MPTRRPDCAARRADRRYNPPVTHDAPSRPPRRSGILRRLIRLALVLCAAVLAYPLTALVLGFLAVNHDWKPTPTGVPIFVRSNGVHVDLVLPARSPTRDWTGLPRSTPDTKVSPRGFVQFGWGERSFFLDTPTWSDVKVSTVANALLLPSSTLMHVVFWDFEPTPGARCKRLLVSADELAALERHVAAGFARNADGGMQLLPGRGYHELDEFFEGVGSYHVFNTCNDWANRGLKSAGIRAPIWSPFDVGILKQLERF